MAPMPTSISAYRDMLLPVLGDLLGRAEGIVDAQMEMDFSRDCIFLMVAKRGVGIIKYTVLTREDILDTVSSIDALLEAVERMKKAMGIVVQPGRMQGADEYDDIMQAQDLMAKITP